MCKAPFIAALMINESLYFDDELGPCGGGCLLRGGEGSIPRSPSQHRGQQICRVQEGCLQVFCHCDTTVVLILHVWLPLTYHCLFLHPTTYDQETNEQSNFNFLFKEKQFHGKEII